MALRNDPSVVALTCPDRNLRFGRGRFRRDRDDPAHRCESRPRCRAARAVEAARPPTAPARSRGSQDLWSVAQTGEISVQVLHRFRQQLTQVRLRRTRLRRDQGSRRVIHCEALTRGDASATDASWMSPTRAPPKPTTRSRGGRFRSNTPAASTASVGSTPNTTPWPRTTTTWGFGRKLARFSVGLAWVEERFETLGTASLPAATTDGSP